MGFACLRDGTPTNKANKGNPNKQWKHQQTREISSKKNFEQVSSKFRARKISSKGYLPIKCKSLQVVGISG